MSKNTVLISHSSISGTDIYLSGGAATQTVYSGSGTPWATESTSPYELGYNVGGGDSYHPKPPEPIPYYVGGPPFALATIPRWMGYGAVTESFGIQMRGTTKDNAIFLLRQLRNALNAGITFIGGSPPLLSIKGGTNTAYHRILSATVVETNSHIPENTSDSSNPYLIRAVVTWTRTAFGGLLSTPVTIFNSTSWANAGTGTPDNLEAFSGGTGDMLDEGGPMNYSIRPSNAGSGDPIRRILLASVYNRFYVGLTVSNTWSTSGTTYATGGAITVWNNALDLGGLTGDYRLRMRLLGVVASGHTGNPEFRYAVYNAAGSSASVIYSGVIPAVNGDGHTTTRFLDSGPIPITVQELRNLSDTNWSVQLQVRSTDGAATTGTLSSVECLLYYDFCDVRFQGSAYGTGAGTNYDMNLTSFSQRSGSPCLPLPYPQAMLTDPSTSNRAVELGEVRGTVPRYYRSAYLYTRLLDASGASSGNLYTVTTRTYTVAAVHAPLYRTLRGAA